MSDCRQVYTHYYKLAHVSAINYAIYSAKEHVSDQLLLELELQIRDSHPQILLAYYNKCLYHFTFSHWDSAESLAEYPIELRTQASASVEMLANPSRAQKKADKKPPPEDLAYASLSFLKAVKKSLLYNLSAQQKMHLFGNYVVANVSDCQYAIVHVDPVLLPTGDLIVSLTQRNSLPLFPASVLSVDTIGAEIGSFVIYVVPSGLRCHLYNAQNLAQSFTKTPPKSASNLLRLLKLSTGVDRAQDDITWVKLIPNLQHLNNQTSKISQFVHDVDNKKFIVWPWDLCILQFGSTERSDDKPEVWDTPDPFSLINDFISFTMDVHDHETQPIHAPPESVAVNESQPTVQDVFEVPSLSNPASTRSGEEKEEKEEVKSTPLEVVENADEDLFGASSDSETEEKREEPREPEPEVSEPSSFSEIPPKAQPCVVEPYVSLSKEEMISRKSQTPVYNDPGAPPPIVPTPIPTHLKPPCSNARDSENPGYAFSPIVFNPKIQSSIDAKYGRGGKFFVDREDSSGPESDSKKPRMRETSVYNVQFSDTEKGLLFKDEKREKPEEDVFEEPDLGSEVEDFDMDDDMDGESDDESDEDEEDHFSDLKMSPLKLNTHSGDILNQISGTAAENRASSAPQTSYTMSGNSNYSDSPSLGYIRSDWRGDSPMAFGSHLVDHGSYTSSPNMDADLDVSNSPEKPGEGVQGGAESDKKSDSRSASEELAPNVSESSNCLPLILRSINVFSIPNTFLLRDGIRPTSSDFNMDFDDDDDDIKSSDGLSVKRSEIDQFLKWLMVSLVFDMGSSKFAQVRLKMPSDFTYEVEESPTDGVVSKNTVSGFLAAYPLSYRVTLDELMEDPEKTQGGEMSFLDEITSDNGGLQSSIIWDSLRPDAPKNKENYELYREEQMAKTPATEDNIFALNEVKSKILKSEELVNFNFVGLRFWRYLNFSPVNGTKKFQVLMVAENDSFVDYGSLYDCSSLGFLETLKCNFKENQLGTVKKLHLQSIRADLESVSNGLLLVEKNGDVRDYYSRVNRKLRNLAEMIKLDLITKSNGFEFDRPLLLLFVNSDESLESISQISKICRNFNQFLKDRQLPLVQVFSHILPWNFVSKRRGNKSTSRYISELKLSKLALTLYNKCPDVHEKNVKTETRRLYTQLVRNTPTSINFKFLNKENGGSGSFQDDLFLHVAYERSVDKNWVSAAWSDPLGLVTHVRSWNCSSTRDVGSIIMDIWDVSNDLFVQLKEALSQRTCGSDKKRFLVLTRISSIIPDDELIFWKRLTAKYKDVSLIVLSTSRLPKYLFSATKTEAYSEADYPAPFNEHPAAMVQSPANASSFNSPNQFLNAPGNFFSPDVATPVDMSEADVVIKDPRYDITGVIPKMPLPSFNSPTRLGMRVGYLIKSKDSDDDRVKYMVFEVTLLSCSAYWSLNSVMKILLNQYKNLIVMNEILGVCDVDRSDEEHELRCLVPWHINAVVKTLDYLVHVRVEE